MLPTFDVQAMNLDQASWQIRQALTTARSQMARAADAGVKSFDGTSVTVQDVPGRAGDIVKAWRRGVEVVRGDDFASHNVKDAAEHVLKNEALLYLADLERNFGRALEAHRAKLVDPAPTLAAADAERIWRRVRDQLQAGVHLGVIVADADDKTLRVIVEELPAHNRTVYPDDIGTADQVTAGQMVLVTDRLYALASPEQRRRLDLYKASDQGAAWVQTAINRARYAVENNDGSEPGGTILVTWDGQTFNV